jgi:hypothetical protein
MRPRQLCTHRVYNFIFDESVRTACVLLILVILFLFHLPGHLQGQILFYKVISCVYIINLRKHPLQQPPLVRLQCGYFLTLRPDQLVYRSEEGGDFLLLGSWRDENC